MDVSFEVVHGDERLVQAEGHRLGITDADQQRACESGTLRHGDCVELIACDVCIG
jgi:hypothetical protein